MVILLCKRFTHSFTEICDWINLHRRCRVIRISAGPLNSVSERWYIWQNPWNCWHNEINNKSSEPMAIKYASAERMPNVNSAKYPWIVFWFHGSLQMVWKFIKLNGSKTLRSVSSLTRTEMDEMRDRHRIDLELQYRTKPMRHRSPSSE